MHLAAQGLPMLQAHPVQGADGNPSSQFVAIPAALFQKHLEALQVQQPPASQAQPLAHLPQVLLGLEQTHAAHAALLDPPGSLQCLQAAQQAMS